MIVKKGKKFLVKTTDGKRTLGTHDNEGDARTQLAAIEVAKAKKKGDEERKPGTYAVMKP